MNEIMPWLGSRSCTLSPIVSVAGERVRGSRACAGCGYIHFLFSLAASGASKPAPIALDDAGQQRYDALKAWRAEVARSHNLPAYVIFHDATLAAIAQAEPQDLEALQGIAGIGAKKLEAYGGEVLRVVTSA